MLYRIKTSNKSLNIDIYELKKVNYFVGKNWQWKSRLLESIKTWNCEFYDKDNNPIPSNQFSLVQLQFTWEWAEFKIKTIEWANEVFEIIGLDRVKQVQKEKEISLPAPIKTKNWEWNLITITTEVSEIEVYDHWWNEIWNGKNLWWYRPSLWTKRLWDVIFNLRKKVFEWVERWRESRLVGWQVDFQKDNFVWVLVCIDEIETALHPSIQNQIAWLIEWELSKVTNIPIYLFISTHSPFVIAWSKWFRDTQRTYLIHSGTTIWLDGEIWWNKWYPWDKAQSVVSQMLWVQLPELVSGIRASSKEQFNIIYCEGDTDIDSDYYQLIFPRDHEGRKNIFVSCKSANDVIQSYKWLNNIWCIWLWDNYRLRWFIDRSCGNVWIYANWRSIVTNKEHVQFSDSEREEIMSEHIWIKILTRKEIENYLYDPVVIDMISIEDQEILMNGCKQWKEAYKNLNFQSWEVKDNFNNLEYNLKVKLAQVIYNNRDWCTKEVYDDLYDCIFTLHREN
jgi:hypothetical protein